MPIFRYAVHSLSKTQTARQFSFSLGGCGADASTVTGFEPQAVVISLSCYPRVLRCACGLVGAYGPHAFQCYNTETNTVVFPGFVCNINYILQSRDGRHAVIGLAGLPVGYASFDTT